MQTQKAQLVDAQREAGVDQTLFHQLMTEKLNSIELDAPSSSANGDVTIVVQPTTMTSPKARRITATPGELLYSQPSYVLTIMGKVSRFLS